jgi:CRISPR/Cas system-associated endonuclease Cas1
MTERPESPDNEKFLRWLETVDDPAERFALASEVLAQQMEAGSRLAAIRAAAAAATYEGSSYGQVAARLGISRSRAQQLVNEGKASRAGYGASAEAPKAKKGAKRRRKEK